jgi:hypothetical protein
MRAFSLEAVRIATQAEEQSLAEVNHRMDVYLHGMKKSLGINPIRVARELHGGQRTSLYLYKRGVAILRERGFHVEADAITAAVDPGYVRRLEERPGMSPEQMAAVIRRLLFGSPVVHAFDEGGQLNLRFGAGR